LTRFVNEARSSILQEKYMAALLEETGPRLSTSGALSARTRLSASKLRFSRLRCHYGCKNVLPG
jgi:hypothetical protein